jgi:tRNA threonylcarbamoyladenosine biosynthesis protein TsaB
LVLIAAIDFSACEVSFAVMEKESGTLLFEEYTEMQGRDSARLLPWCMSILESKGHHINDIIEWTTGTGPGSFTGLRLIASLITGLTFQKDIKTRGIPSAITLGIASETSPGDKIAALYDGRRKEVLLFGMENVDERILPMGRTEVLSETSDLDELDTTFTKFVALEADKEAVETFLPENLNAKAQFFKHLPIAELLNYEIEDWTGQLDDLVYIRPAVFVNPRQKREL